MESSHVDEWNPMKELEHHEQRIGPIFHFSWKKPELRDETLEHFATTLLENGVEYLRAVVGSDYGFAKNIQVEFKKRPRHVAFAATIDVSIDHLREAMTGDTARIDLEQSLFIHELVHGLTEEEELPMMIEFAFMIKKGHGEARLKAIKRILDDGRFPPIYQAGLLNIAHELGFSTLEELFATSFTKEDAIMLQHKFATEIRKEFNRKS